MGNETFYWDGLIKKRVSCLVSSGRTTSQILKNAFWVTRKFSRQKLSGSLRASKSSKMNCRLGQTQALRRDRCILLLLIARRCSNRSSTTAAITRTLLLFNRRKTLTIRITARVIFRITVVNKSNSRIFLTLSSPTSFIVEKIWSLAPFRTCLFQGQPKQALDWSIQTAV